MKLFFGVFKIIEKLEVGVLVMGTLMMASLSVLNVVSRTFFNYTFASVEEINQFLIIAITFIGAGYATSQARHIRMSALYDLLPDAKRKALMMFIALFTAVLCFLLCVYGVQYVITVKQLGTRSPVLSWPYWLVYALAPLGFFTTGIQYALTCVRNLLEPGIWLSFNHQEEIPETPVMAE